MKKSQIILTVVILVVLIALSHWRSTTPATGLYTKPTTTTVPTPVKTSTTQAPKPVSAGSTAPVPTKPTIGLVTSNITLGNYLVAQNGMTLYRYTQDFVGVSNCTGACAVSWPPYTVPAGQKLTTPAGIPNQLSTTQRSDGLLQVTYKGVPLYYWHNDMKAGDMLGQGVGNVWFIVAP